MEVDSSDQKERNSEFSQSSDISNDYSQPGENSQQSHQNKQENTNSSACMLSQYSEKTATEEVSEILSSLPETATDFGSSTQPWASTNKRKVREPVNTNNCVNSSPASSSSSSSSSDNDESEVESSDLDEEDSTRLRAQCIGEMTSIEKQFSDLRDQLYKERHAMITRKLTEVGSETSPEYLQQLRALEDNKQIKLQVAEIMKDLRIDSLEVLLKAEKQANTQHLNNEKAMLVERIQADLDEKVRRLEEDRDNIDTELWADSTLSAYDALSSDRSNVKGKRNKKKDDNVPLFSFGSLKRKKKPATVTGPYIVYMLRDTDILDDWTTIKKAVSVSQRRSAIRNSKKRHLHSCRYEEGKISYGGKLFMKGQSVSIKMHSEPRIFATIASITASEIRVRQNDGKRSKLYIHQLQRGQYTLQHR